MANDCGLSGCVSVTVTDCFALGFIGTIKYVLEGW